MKALKKYWPLILLLVLAVMVFFLGKKNAENLN